MRYSIEYIDFKKYKLLLYISWNICNNQCKQFKNNLTFLLMFLYYTILCIKLFNKLIFIIVDEEVKRMLPVERADINVTPEQDLISSRHAHPLCAESPLQISCTFLTFTKPLSKLQLPCRISVGRTNWHRRLTVTIVWKNEQ